MQGPASGGGAVFKIEVDVVGDEQVEVAVAIVIDKSAAGVPASFRAGLNQSRLFGYIGERAVAVIAIERVLAVVSDEEIVVAVVVVIADAAGLAPTGAVLRGRTLW